MSYGITQCYLPPDRGENPAFSPSRSSDPGGMQGWVDLCYVKATPYRWATTQHNSLLPALRMLCIVRSSIVWFSLTMLTTRTTLMSNMANSSLIVAADNWQNPSTWGAVTTIAVDHCTTIHRQRVKRISTVADEPRDALRYGQRVVTTKVGT